MDTRPDVTSITSNASLSGHKWSGLENQRCGTGRDSEAWKRETTVGETSHVREIRAGVKGQVQVHERAGLAPVAPSPEAPVGPLLNI